MVLPGSPCTGGSCWLRPLAMGGRSDGSASASRRGVGSCDGCTRGVICADAGGCCVCPGCIAGGAASCCEGRRCVKDLQVRPRSPKLEARELAPEMGQQVGRCASQVRIAVLRGSQRSACLHPCKRPFQCNWAVNLAADRHHRHHSPQTAGPLRLSPSPHLTAKAAGWPGCAGCAAHRARCPMWRPLPDLQAKAADKLCFITPAAVMCSRAVWSTGNKGGCSRCTEERQSRVARMREAGPWRSTPALPIRRPPDAPPMLSRRWRSGLCSAPGASSPLPSSSSSSSSASAPASSVLALGPSSADR